MSKFINGALVGTQSSSDARFVLDPSFYIFTDEDNETAPGYVSSFRYVDSALSGEQVRLLGNVNSAGATVAGPTIPDSPPEPPAPTPPLFGRTQIMGHRAGGTLAPENTLAAVTKGFEAGIDLIEIDLHLTSDGHAVVFHDDTLDRTTNGHGLVRARTLAQVRRLDAGKGERVPTLEEVLDLARGRLFVHVELKALGTDLAVVRLVRRLAALDRVAVSSFLHPLLARVKAAEPRLRTGVLYACMPVDPIALATQAGADALHPEWEFVTPVFLRAAHRAGLTVMPWTVDRPADLSRLMAWHVDAICTNQPGRALRLRAKLES